MSTLDRRSFLSALAAAPPALAAANPMFTRAAPAAATPPPQEAAVQQVRADGRRRLGTRFAANLEMWWRHLPFVERIDAAAALGFRDVEFWPWRGKDVAAIAEAAGRAGVRIAQFTGWGFRPRLNDPAHHDAFVEEIDASGEIAAQLGCPRITVVAGDDRDGVPREELHAHVVAALRRAAPVAERHGVVLILEPMNVRVDHPGHCLFGSPPALAITRAVGSPHVKLNWDLYHMQISEGDLCGRLREGFDQVGYVQLADHPGRHEPGTGEIRYNRVLKELVDLGYDGPVGVEATPEQTEELAWERLQAADVWPPRC